MNKLTSDLIERSRGLIRALPEVSDNTGKYMMFDDGGVELETAEFLWGLVRLLKPAKILETGTYTGISALYMAQALRDNGFGRLITLEIEGTHKARAEKLWRLVEVEPFVECRQQSSLDFTSDGLYELIFLDSEPNIRWAELEKFYDYLRPGGYIGIHDVPPSLCQGNINPDHPELPSYPFGDVPSRMAELIKTGRLVKFHLPNPRGSVWFYKPKDEDYQV